MLPLIEEIVKRRAVEDDQGNWIPLHSETDPRQCEFLQRMLQKSDAFTCIEIGLAFGISSLHICEFLAGRSPHRFISIDPYQSRWKDIGLLNLKRCGFDKFTEFHRDFSLNVLPKLLASGLKVDFAYVDTSKVFDVVLSDAIYLSRLLKVGGLLVFDDCNWPGVKRVVRYLSKWPHLQVVARHGEFTTNRKRRLFSSLSQIVPRREHIFRDDILLLDEECGVNATCLAFEKLNEDPREWDWHVAF
jgi:predicted O-methyltransferase YrrM